VVCDSGNGVGHSAVEGCKIIKELLLILGCMRPARPLSPISILRIISGFIGVDCDFSKDTREQAAGEQEIGGMPVDVDVCHRRAMKGV
jgi:hypothetical protein